MILQLMKLNFHMNDHQHIDKLQDFVMLLHIILQLI